MAKYDRTARVSLSRGEIIGGWIFLPFQVALTALLIQTAFAALGADLNNYQLNVIVFVVNFVAAAAIFHRFLFRSLQYIGQHFWLFVQTVILAVVFYFAMNYALSWLFALLRVESYNGNNEVVMGMVRAHFIPMLLCTCLLAPLVEECLCRGLLFTLVREKSRVWAYVVSMLAFALLHVWQFFGQYSFANTLMVIVSYLPAGLALGWAYEKSGTIWCAIFVHGIVNLVVCYTTYYL